MIRFFYDLFIKTNQTPPYFAARRRAVIMCVGDAALACLVKNNQQTTLHLMFEDF